MPFEICVQFVASLYLCTCCLFTDQSKPMASHFCATKKQLCHCPFANVCRNVACPPCFANLQYCLKAAVSARRALKLIDSRYPTASAVVQHTDVSDAAIVLSIATDPLSSDSRAGLHSVDCNNLPTIPGQPDMVCPIHPEVYAKCVEASAAQRPKETSERVHYKQAFQQKTRFFAKDMGAPLQFTDVLCATLCGVRYACCLFIL